MIRQFNDSDYSRVAAIYQQGIDSGLATFNTQTKSLEDWKSECKDGGILVYQEGKTVVAFATLSPVSGRCCYSGVNEVSIYVDNSFHGLGIGKNLLDELIAVSEKFGVWTLQSSILSLNKASINLHLKCGFRIVGVRERISSLNSNWHDVTLMERRSLLTGLD